jgi:hypothetical protein
MISFTVQDVGFLDFPHPLDFLFDLYHNQGVLEER